MRRIMSKVRKIFWNGICIVVLVILLSMLVTKFFFGWSSVFGYRLFWIMSESMEPEISSDSLVIGKTVSDDDELSVGRIYAYQRDRAFGKEMVIHRLIGITEDGRYIFKGDFNKNVDEEPVMRKDVGYVILGH